MHVLSTEWHLLKVHIHSVCTTGVIWPKIEISWWTLMELFKMLVYFRQNKSICLLTCFVIAIVICIVNVVFTFHLAFVCVIIRYTWTMFTHYNGWQFCFCFFDLLAFNTVNISYRLNWIHIVFEFFALFHQNWRAIYSCLHTKSRDIYYKDELFCLETMIFCCFNAEYYNYLYAESKACILLVM